MKVCSYSENFPAEDFTSLLYINIRDFELKTIAFQVVHTRLKEPYKEGEKVASR